MFWKLAFLALSIWAVYYRWQRRRIYKMCEQIPSIRLKSYPLVGHAYRFKGTSEDRKNFISTLGREAVEQGGLATFWMANKLFLCVADPGPAETILRSCHDKDDTARFVWAFLGNGSIFAPVSIWRPRRKILAPVFSMKNLNGFFDEFERQATMLTTVLEPKVGKGDISIWTYINTYTFDAICGNALGINLNSQKSQHHLFLEAFEAISHLVGIRVTSPWLYWDVIYKMQKDYTIFEDHKIKAYDFVDELIQAKRKELAARVDGKETENLYKKNKVFLEMLIESSGGAMGYTDLELREEILVIISAGSDTSAVGASFALVLISRYPEVQEKIVHELQEVFGDTNRPMTAADLSKLVYLEAVMKETLRLYPSVPMFLRQLHTDVTLPSGVTLVEGVGIMMNLMNLHRNRKYWGEDAEQFRPERFLEGPLRHPQQYIPFSYSMRSCLGTTYAMMSMKTAVATMLRRYRLLPPAGLDPAEWAAPLTTKFDIMLRHSDNYIVRLEHRNKQL